MGLSAYQRKRDFSRTPEPQGRVETARTRRFVVHEHHASHLHYDFRLEMGGVLKSWAVPKGPSLNPRQKRLAVMVEDHPVEYLTFSGHIKEGNYGAGDVAIWDTGRYEMSGSEDPIRQLEAGKLSIVLYGKKLHGEFHLVRLKGKARQWLLIKGNDEFAEATQKNAGTTWVESEDKSLHSAKVIRQPRRSRKVNNILPLPHARSITDPDDCNNGVEQSSPLIGARRVAMPRTITPMLATLVNQPFSRAEWLYETKWDGVRTLCFLNEKGIRLVSRNNKEVTARYPELAIVPDTVVATTAILDGEIVAFDEHERSNFQLLQGRVGLKNTAAIARLAREHPAVYCVFDLLYYDGWDLRSAALSERKQLLRQILRPAPSIRYSEHTIGDGKQRYAAAQQAGLEGIVAKQARSLYVTGRSREWLKIKTVQRQEVVVAGYTQPRGTRPLLGALVVGLYRNNILQYVGHVGGGFDHQTLRQVYDLVQPLKTTRSPFPLPPETNEPVQWVRPVLVCEVKFSAWTADRRLRQPIFLGLRDDKAPRQCIVEPVQDTEATVKATEDSSNERDATAGLPVVSVPQALRARNLHGDLTLKVEGHTVALTHLERVYWPTEGYRKGDLLRYYFTLAPALLPYLRERPLILKRHPHGITGQSFYQHDVDAVPDFVETFSTPAESGKVVDYAVCNNLATLLYLVNLGTIAQNPWHSRVQSIDRPDWVVFDLDPYKVEFAAVQELALGLKVLLDGLGLASYPKTSGASGLHVYVPIASLYSYEQVAQFAEFVARHVVEKYPRLATLERSLKKRKGGTIYFDHLQNARGKSVVAPYSVRAQAGATVSTPLTWAEVKRPLSPHEFTLATLPQRLTQHGDLFTPVLTQKQELGEAVEKLEDLFQPGHNLTAWKKRPRRPRMTKRSTSPGSL